MGKSCTLMWTAERGTTMAQEWGASGTIHLPTEKVARRIFKEMTRSYEYDPGHIHVVLKNGQYILAQLEHNPEVLP